jgi:hypothetical protein
VIDNYTSTLGTTDVVASSIPSRQEALLWAFMAWNLLESDFEHHISRLVNAQVVTLKEDEIKMSGAGPLIGRLIPRNVLIPHLGRRQIDL